MYYVYILRCSDNSLYTGSTSDIKRRFNEHFSQKPQGAKYTKSHQALSLEAVWECESKSDAMKLEFRIKQLTKEKKERLVKDNVAPDSLVYNFLDYKFKRIHPEHPLFE